MWLRLLKINSIREALQPRLVKGRWHPPLLSGRNKGYLRKQFLQAGVPWVFEKEKDPNRSAYNRMPKRIYKEYDKEEKILALRAALKNNQAVIQKYREEKVKNKPITGIDKVIQSIIPSVLKLQGQRKRKLVISKELGLRRPQQEISDPDESILDFSEVKSIKRGKQNVGSMGGRIKAKKRDLLGETASIIGGKSRDQ